MRISKGGTGVVSAFAGLFPYDLYRQKLFFPPKKYTPYLHALRRPGPVFVPVLTGARA